MKNNIKKLLILYIIVANILLVVFLFVYFSKGRIHFDTSDVEINHFSICSLEDIVYERASEISRTIDLGTEYIFVCGFLRTKSPIDFEVFLYRASEKLAFSHDSINDVNQGFFYKKFFLPEELAIGDYRIGAYFYREIIASTTFSIVEP
jgi:hypothetical protein